jgi:mono/diheme cytochrome c family protein
MEGQTAMTRPSIVAAAALMLGTAFTSIYAFSQSPSRDNAPARVADAKKAPQAGSSHPSEGQRIFQQNCSRCHAAPEGFSPRISGTVVRHMRMRASLSQKEEQELLRFLNP